MTVSLQLPIPKSIDRYVLGPNTVTRINCRLKANESRRYWVDRTNKVDYAEAINSCPSCGAFCFCFTYIEREHVWLLLEQMLAKYAKSETRRFMKKFGLRIDNHSVYCADVEFADIDGHLKMTVIIDLIRSKNNKELIGRARIAYVVDARTLKIVETKKKISTVRGVKLTRRKKSL
jgi:hypothetical protein